jgi:Flp pilus assembly protein TadG
MRRLFSRSLFSREDGAELLEFALVLPILLVMLVGVIDFGQAWAVKDKLAGAAREGARVAIAEFNDTTNPQCSGGTPCSVQAAASAATAYLNNAGVDICGLDPATSTPTAGTFAWTYTSGTCASGTTWTLLVERAVPMTNNGVTALGTRVTLSYPFAWNFANVAGLLGGTNFFTSTVTLNSAEIMTNLS